MLKMQSIKRSPLILQLVILLLVSFIFALRKVDDGISAFWGGFSVWLPYWLFVFYIGSDSRQHKKISRIDWTLVVGEIIRIALTILLLISLLIIFSAPLVPVFSAFFTVTILQIIFPSMVS